MTVAVNVANTRELRRVEQAISPESETWIGPLPSHWSVRPLKTLTSFVSRGNTPDYVDESDIYVLNQSCVQRDGLHLEHRKYQRHTVIRNWKGRLENGDIVINSTGTGTLGRVAIFAAEGDWIADGHITIVRSREAILHPGFLRYLLGCDLYEGYIYAALAMGATNQIELNRDSLRSLPIVLPPWDEQCSIVTYLDQETLRLDVMINKKQRLIELLQEKRGELLEDAFTQRADNLATMENSTTARLDEVPAHWSFTRVASLAVSIQTGPFGSQLHASDYVDNGIPIVNPSHMSGGRILPDSKATVDEETASRLARHRLQSGDIVLARRGELGRCAIVTGLESGWLCGTGSLRIRPRTDRVIPEYLLQVLSTRRVREWLSIESVGATMDNLNTGILARLSVPIPPLGEQTKILERFRDQALKLDGLVDLLQASIERLSERRIALVNDTVTGRLDTRGMSGLGS